MSLIAYAGLLSVALAALASPRLAAQADPPIDTTRWVLVGTASDGTRNYIDTTTVQRAGDTVTVWTQDRYPGPKQAGGGRGTRTLSRIAFDCADAQSLALYFIEYDGLTVAETLSKADFEAAGRGWTPMAPGTIGEVDSKFACSLPPRAAHR